MHNDANQPYVGGVFQANGYSSTLGELATVLVAVSLYISKYFDFDDLFEELTEIIRDSDKDAENIQS